MEAHVLTSSLCILPAKVRIISYITKKINLFLKKSPSLNQKLREGVCRRPSPMGDSSSLLEAFYGVIVVDAILCGVGEASDSSHYTVEGLSNGVVECTIEVFNSQYITRKGT